MEIGLSYLTLVPGISGGSEIYARELARALGHVGRHSYRALVPSIAVDAASDLPATVVHGYRASRSTAGRLWAMAEATVRPGPLSEDFGDVDVVHYPLTVPVPRDPRPSVVTLLDTQHLDLPRLFSRGERAFRRLAYDRTARQADRVVVISEWVRGRAVERLGLDPGRVRTIHLGVDHERFSPDVDRQREPFLLYPARPWPHKNHARLFAAFAALRARHQDLRLLLTGQGHDRTALPPGVEVRGSVGVEELVELYRTAAAVVFPSLYEGFGLPPIEAMACGCPVASSNAGSLPEVCGDAAVLFDPYDVEAIAAGVETALSTAPELSARGLTRAASFTWENTARAHDVVYAEAAGG